eukprot:m.50848 g.50848  ORF g.50848 m.50848 type:complete len:376 (+) comp21357_c0_seq1:135-1262(+)
MQGQGFSYPDQVDFTLNFRDYCGDCGVCCCCTQDTPPKYCYVVSGFCCCDDNIPGRGAYGLSCLPCMCVHGIPEKKQQLAWSTPVASPIFAASRAIKDKDDEGLFRILGAGTFEQGFESVRFILHRQEQYACCHAWNRDRATNGFVRNSQCSLGYCFPKDCISTPNDTSSTMTICAYGQHLDYCCCWCTFWPRYRYTYVPSTTVASMPSSHTTPKSLGPVDDFDHDVDFCKISLISQAAKEGTVTSIELLNMCAKAILTIDPQAENSNPQDVSTNLTTNNDDICLGSRKCEPVIVQTLSGDDYMLHNWWTMDDLGVGLLVQHPTITWDLGVDTATVSSKELPADTSQLQLKQWIVHAQSLSQPFKLTVLWSDNEC